MEFDGDYQPEDLQWIAEDVAMDLHRRWDEVLQRSRDTAENEDLRRFANSEVERQRAKEDEETRLALSVSQVESNQAEEAEFQKAKLESRVDERARAERAEREQLEQAVLDSLVTATLLEQEQKEAIDKAIVESELTVKCEQKRKAGELTRCLAKYTINDLTEEEHMRLSILLSQEKELRHSDAAVLPATLTVDGGRPSVKSPHPATAGTLSSPPVRIGPSVLSVPSSGSLLYRTEEENPGRRVELLKVSRSTPSDSRISENHLVYPGAFPASPSQASSAARGAVGRPKSNCSTPLLPGAYVSSYAGSTAPHSEAGSLPGMLYGKRMIIRRPLSTRRSSERLSGTYPPPSQANDSPNRSATVSTGDTFITTRESLSPQLHAQPQRALSDSWRNEYHGSQQREAQESRSSTSFSLYSLPSRASSVGQPPSSQTSRESVARKPVANSRPLAPVATVSRPPKVAADAVVSAAVASSHPQQLSIHYHINGNGPVTINNYKVPENTTSSLSLAQHVPTRDGGNIANGMKEATIGFKTIAEVKSAAKNLARSATQSELWSRGEERAAILRRKGKRFKVDSPRIEYATVNEIGDFERASVPEVQNDVGSIAPLPQTQQWFVTNPDVSRSNLNTPEAGGSPSSEHPMSQTVGVIAPRMPLLQRSTAPSPLSTTTQQMTTRPPPWDESMILDVNGDAVTPPSDRQSDSTSFSNDGSIIQDTAGSTLSDRGLRPQPLNFGKRTNTVLRKPQNLAGMPSTKPSQSPPRSRNPMSRYMAQVQKRPDEWLQRPVQFSFLTQGSAPGSPDSMAAEAPTPGRVNEALGRRSKFPPIDTSLANVPPGERSINYFNSRSMADYGRMAHVGNPEIMGVQREQYQ
ncbi:unnamed protein product [Alternaria alternata]